MNHAKIRRFRALLREFELATKTQRRNCCGGVSLAQCVVLLEIEQSTELTIGQLASRLRLDNSTLSRTIDGLVKQGLVQRQRDDRDRRVVGIRLTARGRSACRSIHTENDAHCRRVFEKIPPFRHHAVIRAFEVLTRAYLDCETESSPPARPDPAVWPRSVRHGAREGRENGS